MLGYEALTRFADGVRPDRRFGEAAAVGLGVELEEACVAAAIRASRLLPAGPWVSVNVSPALVLAEGRLGALVSGGRGQIVLEITEHTAIEDYAALRAAVAALGENVRLAIDDAGAGYASFRHILELRPDFVKLDIALVHAIQADHARQALVAGMRYFALKTGSALIAEGIEEEEERSTLLGLAVRMGQGYLLGAPERVAAEA